MNEEQAGGARSLASGCAAAIARVLVVLVLIVAALVLAGSRGRARTMLGGAAPRANKSASVTVPGGPEPSELGRALNEYVRHLGPEDAVGYHPLDQDKYTGRGETLGGAPARKAKSSSPRAWHRYPTWDALREDAAATDAYLEERAEVLESPSLDWSAVLEQVRPRLAEPREYIGLINLGPDGRTLRVEDIEASPVTAKDSRSETTFASIPAALVERFASRPALFLFHTHPDDPRCSPLPSSHDLSTAVYLGSMSRFAANVIISNYGVIVYGLSWCAYKAINASDDRRLAYLNLSHDVVAAHEAIRSWAPYSLAEYLSFYPRHRLFCYAYPSSRMVADRRSTYSWSLEAPIDLELIEEHGRDIVSYLKKAGKSRARSHDRGAQGARHGRLAGFAPIPGPPRAADPGEARPCRALPPSGPEHFPPFVELPRPTDLGLD